MLNTVFKVMVILYIGIQLFGIAVAFTFPSETMALYQQTLETLTLAAERCGS